MGSSRRKPFSLRDRKKSPCGPVVSALGFARNPEEAAAGARQAFQGEAMECVFCGVKSKSSPHTNTQWRMVQLDGDKFYACPQEFPSDRASADEFEEAYRLFMLKAVEKRKLRKVN